MNALLCLYVVVAGALTSVEAGGNAKMTQVLGGPWWAALIFCAVTALCLAAAACFVAGPFPAAKLGEMPWWVWSAGVISALYVVSMLIGPGRLGSGVFTGLTVTAAVISSIALDHFGLMGFKQHSAGLGRLIGAGLMVAGIVCVAVF